MRVSARTRGCREVAFDLGWDHGVVHGVKIKDSHIKCSLPGVKHLKRRWRRRL